MNQREMRFIGPTQPPSFESDWIIERLPTFRASLRHAVARSGWTQAEIAKALEVDAGEFCRMVNEPKPASRPREFPNEKLRDFCAICRTYAPLQWLAMRSEAEVVPARRMTADERLARLEAENADLRARCA